MSEVMTAPAKAEVVNRNNKAEGVDLEMAKNSATVMSTNSWTDREGNKHAAAPTQNKQPVSISYSKLEKSDGTTLEFVTVHFKKSGVSIRGFSGEFAHLLTPKKDNPKIGVIIATEMSYEARTKRFSTDEVEMEPSFDEEN